MRIKNHFFISGFALSLALKQRLQATRKRPNPMVIFNRYRFKLCEKKTKGNELKLPYKRTVVSQTLKHEAQTVGFRLSKKHEM